MEGILNQILIIAGLLVLTVVSLFWGRKVFWLFGGFLFGLVGLIVALLLLEPTLITSNFDAGGFYMSIDVETWSVPLIVSTVVSAVIGALFTIRFPRAAAAIVGFGSGALGVIIVLLQFDVVLLEWVRRTLMIVVGTALAVVAVRQTSETMIVISTLFGAGFLMTLTQAEEEAVWAAFLWLAAMLAGIIYQTYTWRKEQHKKLKAAQVKGDAAAVRT